MPAALAFHQRDAFSLERLRQNHRWPAFGLPRPFKGVEHIWQIVAIDDECVPPERSPARGKRVQVVLPLRRSALAEAVDVGDSAERVECMARCHIPGLPHRAFSRLTVTHEHVRAVVRSYSAGIQGNADTGTQALTQRPCGHVDKRQPRRRMALKVRVNSP